MEQEIPAKAARRLAIRYANFVRLLNTRPPNDPELAKARRRLAATQLYTGIELATQKSLIRSLETTGHQPAASQVSYR